MKQSQRIVKNAVLGVAAGVVGGLVYLATTIVIARNHNVSLAEFGKYQWVLAFAMIAQLVADSGLPRMMIREIAKDPEVCRQDYRGRGRLDLGHYSGEFAFSLA